MAVVAPGRDHGDAGGERGHRLAEEGRRVVAQRRDYPQRSSARLAVSLRPRCASRRAPGRSPGGRVRWWAPRLSSRARRSGRSAGRAGTGRPPARAGRRRERSSPAWRQSAARVAGVGGTGSAPRPVAAAVVGRLGSAGARRAPRGGRTRSTRRASSTPAGWRRAGRCRRTRRPRAGPAATSGRRGRSRCRPSCSARPARPARARAPGRCPPRPARRRCSGSARRRPSRMSSDTARSPLRSSSREDRERHLVARRQLVHEALAARRSGASRPRRAPPR